MGTSEASHPSHHPNLNHRARMWTHQMRCHLSDVHGEVCSAERASEEKRIIQGPAASEMAWLEPCTEC